MRICPTLGRGLTVAHGAHLGALLLFPLPLGGIPGQVRDRLGSPGQAPGAFGKYGRAFYSRLLVREALVGGH